MPALTVVLVIQCITITKANQYGSIVILTGFGMKCAGQTRHTARWYASVLVHVVCGVIFPCHIVILSISLAG